MAKRNFHLSDDQRADLWQAYYETQKPQEQRCFQAVRLYGEAWSVAAIQAAVGCAAPTLMRWVKRYREGGVGGLRWRVRGGNRARLTPSQRAEVRQRLKETRPDQWLGAHERSSSLPFWTLEDVIVLIARWYSVRWHSRTSYWTLLRACGLSVQRVNARYHSRPAPEVLVEAQAQLEKK